MDSGRDPSDKKETKPNAKCSNSGTESESNRIVLSCLFFHCHSTHGESQERVLRGVMRVSLVAKGLLLKGDKDLELVLLCSNKPTATLLTQVAEKLMAELEVKMNSCSFSLTSSCIV